MLFSTKKFNKEISRLKALKADVLHPLTKAKIKLAVLSNLNSGEVVVKPSNGFFNAHTWILRYLAPFVGLSVLLGGTAFASNSSLPGDILYPVKQAKEQIQLSFSPNEESKAELKAQFAVERSKELKKIRDQKKVQKPTSAPTPTPLSTATIVSITPTPTPTPTPKNNLEIEAENNLKTSVKELRTLRSKLERKGKKDAAQKLNKTIIELQLNEDSKTNEDENLDDSSLDSEFLNSDVKNSRDSDNQEKENFRRFRLKNPSED